MGIFQFLNRNARIAITAAIVLAAMGGAGAIGWLTAPVA